MILNAFERRLWQKGLRKNFEIRCLAHLNTEFVLGLWFPKSFDNLEIAPKPDEIMGDTAPKKTFDFNGYSKYLPEMF